MIFRTDRHRNPAAFTTDIAKQAGLVLGVDYEIGEPFDNGRLFTAKLLGDPIEITIRVIDKVGYYTKSGVSRWTYIAIPAFIWYGLDEPARRKVIGFHYSHEGGKEMADLFV